MLKIGRTLAGLLIVLFLMSPAFADKKEDFREAYQAYKGYVKAGDTEKAMEMAAESYRLGSKVFGKQNPNTAKLAINYAALLNDAGSFRKAGKVLKGKLKIMEDRYGADATELSSVLIELGRSEFDVDKPDEGLGYFIRASRVLEGHENALHRARKNFDIAMLLSKREGNAHTQEYIEKAHAIYSRELPTNDFRRGLTSYHMGRHALDEQQHEKALEYFNGSLDAFRSDDGKMGDLERTVRIQLIAPLEILQRREEATEHCLALGRAQEWKMPVLPIYRTDPVAPLSAIQAGLTGKVTMTFAVDEKGYVVDPRVARSTQKAFNQAALDMIREFRYAPRFADGKPVLTDGVKYSVRFSPADKKRKERIPGFDAGGRAPTRWRLEQHVNPGGQNPGGK